MPPFILRCVFGVLMYGLFAPFVWCLERLGLTVRVFSRVTARQRQEVAAKNPFKGYVPTSHDVFIATFVKSGTNWMMQIVHQLAFHGEADFEHIHCVVPWPDTTLMGPMKRYAVPLEDPFVWMASPEGKRVIKTHFSWELLPYSEDARYIMVIRDPKDVFVSSYFFFLKNGPMGPVAPSVDTWLEFFLSDRFFINGSWAANTAGYWAQRHRKNVLICSFGSMRRDLPGTVRTVAKFLDIHVSDEVIARVCEKSSFDYMKGIDDKFRVWKMIPWGSSGPMMRKGTEGGSSELLSPEQQRRIDEYFVTELERLGSDFPYSEFCDVTARVRLKPDTTYTTSQAPPLS
jgi:sulfotransferase family protein